jgi:hypothetical protein
MANILYLGASDTISYTGAAGKVIIGATTGSSKFEVKGGDIEITDSTRGLILKDSNGIRWRVKISTSGTIETVQA